jgi:K+-sensing histidine kinase KdpD
MIESMIIPVTQVEDFAQNIGLIAILVFIYNVLPDRFRNGSKYLIPVVIGITFGLAAVLSMIVPIEITLGLILEIKTILVPLAGFIGGPIAAVVVAAIAILFHITPPQGLDYPWENTVIIAGAIIGTAFHFFRPAKSSMRSEALYLFLLGSALALAYITVIYLYTLPALDGIIFQPRIILTTSAAIIAGVLLLGLLLELSDRKKIAETGVRQYQEHLESLVKERTKELELALSLKNATLDSTADGILVMNPDGTIRAYNQRLTTVLDLPAGLIEDKDAKKILDYTAGRMVDPSRFRDLMTAITQNPDKEVIKVLKTIDGNVYELHTLPERMGSTVIGQVLNFRDITEQKHAEEAIRIANSKLSLLSSITRHDILNQITALYAYLDLAEMRTTNPESRDILQKMRQILTITQAQIEFTRDYEDMGLASPAWQDAGATFRLATGSWSGRDIGFTGNVEGLEVYADPMLVRVFDNLIDNSLRHGERVTEIRFSAQPAPGRGLLLVYEDNGTGVAANEKQKIFQKDFGKHTGLGMFLAREILSITGITVAETGTTGTGVRFEILVPEGRYRQAQEAVK